MRFLLEADNDFQDIAQRTKERIQSYTSERSKYEDKMNYLNLPKDKKIKFLKDKLKNEHVDVNEWAYAIAEDEKIPYTENPIYKLALKIPKETGKITTNTLIALADRVNDHSDTIVNSDWVKDLSLYNDDDANIAYKIKVLTLIDENNKDINKFKDKDGKFLPMSLFRMATYANLSDVAGKSKGKKNIYTWLLEKRRVPNLNSDNDKQNLVNMLAFIKGIVFPNSNYNEKYIQLKKFIDEKIENNKYGIYDIVWKLLNNPYREGFSEKDIYNLIIEKISKLLNLDSPNNTKQDSLKQGVIQDLINMGRTKSEAIELVNSTYNPNKSRDENVRLALQAWKK